MNNRRSDEYGCCRITVDAIERDIFRLEVLEYLMIFVSSDAALLMIDRVAVCHGQMSTNQLYILVDIRCHDGIVACISRADRCYSIDTGKNDCLILIKR